jgi:hypothetical protein
MILVLEGSHTISDSFYLQISIKGTHLLVELLFTKPSLSKTNRFSQEVTECWGIQMNARDEKPELVKGTVLERFKEDRNMPKMVGLANASD